MPTRGRGTGLGTGTAAEGRLRVMTSPDSISPRGVPQIRTDWLADVARRLAGVGLDRLRALGEGATLELTDVVDGQRWSLEAFSFTRADATVVDFDAELYAPADHGGRPSLRAGFSLAPRWDADHGAITRVRVEIGPRGAVTFDPENWMVPVPRDPAFAAPVPAGVEPGDWTLAKQGGALAGTTQPAPAAAGPAPDLAGLRLDLADLEPILGGESVPELVIGAFPPPAKGGLLGRLRPRAPEPAAAILQLAAAGPLEAAWTGTESVDQVVADGFVVGQDEPVLAGEQLTVRGPGGVLTLGGPGLRVAIVDARGSA